jgi:diguanylate cyclase (GGDEF)-like protein
MSHMDAGKRATWIAAVEAPVPAGATGLDPAPAPKPRVLVVDDVFDNRDILVRRLSRRGFEVLEAAGGREALDMVASNDFDVVLLDIMMPDLNGNEVLRIIRETRSATQLPVIMVTAKSQSEDVVESFDIGANDYVTKPLDFAVALARINQQIARKRAADADAAVLQAIKRDAAALRLLTSSRPDASIQRNASDQDRSQDRQTEERLRHLAYHDALTGLLNRTSFRERLDEALRDPDQLANLPVLLFLDLDGFKAVNDVHGHGVGDKLLQDVGARLRETLGPQVPLARLGGDEFAVLCFEKEGVPSASHARHVVAALKEPFHIDGRHLQIGASCGMARAIDCANDVEAISRAADLALYRAKSVSRGGHVSYEPWMLDEQQQRNELEAELRQAIHEDRLDVVYQPMVSSESQQVTALEALARWPHPTRGLILPDTFIQLAEETGLIVALGAWVMRQACREAATWPSDVRVAVNVSALQFRSPDLLPTIVSCLASNGLDASRLEIEITESVLLEARGRDVDIFRAIQDLGVRISMDDFGTGYSSLAYLQSFDFDKIKLDRQLVRRAQSEVTFNTIVKAVVALANNFGMEVTAEGVETESELATMRELGCTEIQGYLFSRPLASNDVRAFIARRLA